MSTPLIYSKTALRAIATTEIASLDVEARHPSDSRGVPAGL
jgi:hypothetical protein